MWINDMYQAQQFVEQNGGKIEFGGGTSGRYRYYIYDNSHRKQIGLVVHHTKVQEVCIAKPKRPLQQLLDEVDSLLNQ